jgi:hypothetical protein
VLCDSVAGAALRGVMRVQSPDADGTEAQGDPSADETAADETAADEMPTDLMNDPDLGDIDLGELGISNATATNNTIPDDPELQEALGITPVDNSTEEAVPEDTGAPADNSTAEATPEEEAAPAADNSTMEATPEEEAAPAADNSTMEATPEEEAAPAADNSTMEATPEEEAAPAADNSTMEATPEEEGAAGNATEHNGGDVAFENGETAAPLGTIKEGQALSPEEATKFLTANGIDESTAKRLIEGVKKHYAEQSGIGSLLSAGGSVASVSNSMLLGAALLAMVAVARRAD